MEELVFTKHVAPVSATTNNVPEYKREEHIESLQAPNYGDEFRDYANKTNWMSAIGSQVATTASNAIATQIGGEMGKKPTGDLNPAITDFDKHLAESYSTQAHATLGIQADKLITDSNLELSNLPSLTPDIIAKKQKQVALGLQQIYAQAPTDIRPKLEYTYNTAQISQNEQLQHKMITQQHEERRNNTILANDKNASMAHSLSASGNFDAAQKLVETNTELNNSAVSSNIGFTPQQGKVGTDTVRQSAINGRLQYKYDQARAVGKEAEFLRSLDKKPDWISDEDYLPVRQNLLSYVSQQDSIERKDQELTKSKFNLHMARDFGSITGSDIIEAQNKLSTKDGIDLEISYYKQKAINDKKVATTATGIQNFGNYNIFPTLSEKVQYESLQSLSQKLSDETGVPLPQAEMLQASMAAGPIKKYLNVLSDKALSGNPTLMNEALAAREFMYASDKGANLIGMSDKAKVSLEKYAALRDGHDEVTAAQMVNEVMNTNDVAANQKAYNNWVQKNKATGMTNDDFALKVADIDKDAIVNVPELSHFVETKLNTFFDLTKANEEQTKKLLRDDINSTFGYETFNGHKQFSHLPFNKVYNIPEEANPYAHQNVADQLTKQFSNEKKLYDQGAGDFYWEVVPRIALDTKDEPNQVVQHWRDGNTKTYQVYVKAGANLTRSRNQPQNSVYGSYDVNVREGNTIRSIYLIDPHVGNVHWIPDREKIMNDFRNSHEYHHYFMKNLALSTAKKLSSDLVNKNPQVMATKGYSEFVKQNYKEEKKKNPDVGVPFGKLIDEKLESLME